ncbi:MAG: CDC27 family protein, partial [Nautiliaceae bacterium]
SKSYDLAIILAKRYLRMNNLKKAQYWALRANELDPQKPDSWIVFAKILAKQGKKDKAIQVLNTYIDSYGENEVVNDTLNELKEGK